MLSDEYPELGVRSPAQPRTLGGTSVTISVYVEDVDDVFDRALQAGATVLRPIQDQFYGAGRERLRIPSGTGGAWQPTLRTSRLRRWPRVPPRRAAEPRPQAKPDRSVQQHRLTAGPSGPWSRRLHAVPGSEVP